MPTCRRCGEAIEFVELVSGRRNPVDADSLALHVLAPGVVVVTPDGRVLRGTEATRQTSVQGYTSHFATCPFAGDFRREN